MYFNSLGLHKPRLLRTLFSIYFLYFFFSV
uniref:Uncharacterized protein n=1 Tax=Myoviridae sp. ctqfO1 TaxID=2827710 RepID=A0A8S5T2A0_9CAUD|nr:MAG TPA: hypothetical protein [Myoviridae sp. ctqfO1]